MPAISFRGSTPSPAPCGRMISPPRRAVAPAWNSKGSFLRKGIVGDWRSKFDQRCLERFAAAKDGRWQRLADAVATRRSMAVGWAKT